MSTECATHELVWTEPDDERHVYILQVDGKEAGWLRFDPAAEEHATGELRGRRYLFEPAESQVPFPSVTVRQPGAPHPLATFTQRWNGGGSAVFASGARYCWNPVHIWSSTWCFRLEGSNAAVCVSQEAFPLNAGGKAKCSGVAPAEDAPVLILLGWYLRVVSRNLQAETINP